MCLCTLSERRSLALAICLSVSLSLSFSLFLSLSLSFFLSQLFNCLALSARASIAQYLLVLSEAPYTNTNQKYGKQGATQRRLQVFRVFDVARK